MIHGFTEQHWLGFLDGTLDAAQRSLLASHAESCPECSAGLADMSDWHRALSEEARHLRDALKLDQPSMDAALENCLLRIRESRPMDVGRAPGWTVTEGITMLRFLLEPICGPGTAKAAIGMAMERSAVDGGRITGRNWRLFIGNLSDSATLICGLAVGRMVDRAGLSLKIVEQAA